MRVNALTPEQVGPGARIRVTGVAPTEAESLGYVNDQERLLGQAGTVEALHTGPFAYLVVKWDDKEPGTLYLAGNDEIEVIDDSATA